MGTRKISQLETISDDNLSGEAILPVVVSDPLIPNRKAKVNQLHKGVAQGTINAPGLAFDLDRDTGLYQNAYNELGVTFGTAAVYFTKVTGSGGGYDDITITALDSSSQNANLRLVPRGSGSVSVGGDFRIRDENFFIQDTSGKTVRFECGESSGSTTQVSTYSLPTVIGNLTTLVGTNTAQSITNKTIDINDTQLTLIDSDEATIKANFIISMSLTGQNTTRKYLLPDPGLVSTDIELETISSTLLDTKATQTVINKTFVNVGLAQNTSTNTPSVTLNTDAVTQNRIASFPDQSFTIVGEDSIQTLSNKSIETLVLQDPTDNTKKVTFDLSNSSTLSNAVVTLPRTDLLNNGGNTNIFVTELAIQEIRNKTLYNPILKQEGNLQGQVTLSAEGITGPRVIRFPDADATLLSTENVTLDDVNFGAGIGANNLTGQTRLQQFFYAGF